MSTKAPLVINKSSWKYKLHTILSMGSSPKKAWHYRCGVVIMIVTYFFMILFLIVEVIAAAVFLAAVLSPIVLHVWPDNAVFLRLHDRLYLHLLPAIQISLVLAPLVMFAYWQRDRLAQFGNWLLRHKLAGRPIKIVED